MDPDKYDFAQHRRGLINFTGAPVLNGVGVGNPQRFPAERAAQPHLRLVTDVCLFRFRAEYNNEEGMFRFSQSRTDSPVSITISDQLGSLL